MYKWITRQDGVVEVDGKVIELLTGFEIEVLKRDVFRWLPFAEKHAKEKGVPVAWVLGFIYAESLGRQRIVSPDKGYGLMQLTHPGVFKGHSPKSTLDDPELNISLGTSVMSSVRRNVGFDLPKIASGYNAGLSKGLSPYPSTRSPWGMRETPGHIERAVRASNTSIRLLKLQETPMGTPNERLAEAATKILSRGEMGDKVRGDEFEAFLDAAFGNGKALRTVYSSCAYFLAACMFAAGLTKKRAWPIARAITTWLGVRGFVPPGWIPVEKLKTPEGELALKRGDIPYWCGGNDSTWYAAKNGHVGCLIAGAGHMWQTAEGGGGADGTLCRMSKEVKDIRKSGTRPFRGVWRPNEMFKQDELHIPDTEPAMPVVHPTLRRGCPKQPAVGELQRVIGAKVDDDFGPKTEAALKAFQKKHGLVADGICGPLTWQVVDRVRDGG